MNKIASDCAVFQKYDTLLHNTPAREYSMSNLPCDLEFRMIVYAHTRWRLGESNIWLYWASCSPLKQISTTSDITIITDITTTIKDIITTVTIST